MNTRTCATNCQAAPSHYGIVFELEPALVYRALGADLKTLNESDDLSLPIASAFVIGQDGRIRQAFVNVDYSERAEPRP
ncbi:hypothetical protein [Pseudomonas putida]|uniref:hypothetical protein n=1 Tax=Pseudomonas putida TaxID=303 RepID=UPI0018C86E7C|nr:hypothetical protein [Pseudomonas putida]